jgi:hypothetical protein
MGKIIFLLVFYKGQLYQTKKEIDAVTVNKLFIMLITKIISNRGFGFCSNFSTNKAKELLNCMQLLIFIIKTG